MVAVEYAIAGALVAIAVTLAFSQLREGLLAAMQYIVSLMGG